MITQGLTKAGERAGPAYDEIMHVGVNGTGVSVSVRSSMRLGAPDGRPWG